MQATETNPAADGMYSDYGARLPSLLHEPNMFLSQSLQMLSLHDVHVAAVDCRLEDPNRTEYVEEWSRVIDHQLLEWARDPASLEDDGADPPSVATIMRAIEVAATLRDAGLPSPDKAVLDPNGGIVFRRSEGELREAIHVWDDDETEYIRYDGTRIVERGPLA